MRARRPRSETSSNSHTYKIDTDSASAARCHSRLVGDIMASRWRVCPAQATWGRVQSLDTDRKHSRMTALVALVVLFALVIAGAAVSWVQNEREERAQQLALEAFLYDEYRLMPVRFHLLESEMQEPLHCQLTVADVGRILGKVNLIWQQANIYFYLESVVQETAANQFVIGGFTRGAPIQLYPLIRPPQSMAHNMFHLYCIHEFQPNGATIGGHDVIFFKDTATLLPVEGGMDEPLPRVLSHQLGYALSLRNVEDGAYLMSNGTTGTLLSEREVFAARQAVESIEWHKTPTTMSEAANSFLEEGAMRKAAQLYETLMAVPGRSPLKDSAQDRMLEIDGASNQP